MNQKDLVFPLEEKKKTKILKYLSKKYPNTKLLLTLGRKGSVYSYNNKVIEISANKVSSIDTTAAGDTYIGYFISSYYKNNEVKRKHGDSFKSSKH